jgi:ribosome-binding protein aMBF1 (putative translation factor)
MKDLTNNLKAIRNVENYIKQSQGTLATLWRIFLKDARKNREEKGISLRTMAKKIGVSAAYLSDVELGRRSVTSRIRAMMLTHYQ